MATHYKATYYKAGHPPPNTLIAQSEIAPSHFLLSQFL